MTGIFTGEQELPHSRYTAVFLSSLSDNISTSYQQDDSTYFIVSLLPQDFSNTSVHNSHISHILIIPEVTIEASTRVESSLIVLPVVFSAFNIKQTRAGILTLRVPRYEDRVELRKTNNSTHLHSLTRFGWWLILSSKSTTP